MKDDPYKMKLPEGNSCGDCAHYRRCKMLFACKETNVECDFAPSRFYAVVSNKLEKDNCDGS